MAHPAPAAMSVGGSAPAVEPHAMAVRHARSLAQRYALLLTLAAVPLLILLAALGLQQLDSQRRAQLSSLAQLAREQRLALEGAIEPLRDHVQILRQAAEDRLTGNEPRTLRPWRELLQPVQATTPNGVLHGLGLDHLAGDPNVARLGNVMADSSLLARPPEATGEIEMALALAEPMRLAHLVTPYLQWSYYLSAQGDLISMFPFAPFPELAATVPASSMHEMIAGWLAYDVFTAGTPARNPERSAYWTSIYADAGGSGWMVSHAAPVYEHDRFVGVVGTDLRLAALSTFLGRLSWPAGQVWVVNDQGQVLAGHGIDTQGAASTLLLDEQLASELRGLPVSDLLRPSRGFRHEQGHWLAAERLEGTPFTLLYAVSDRELNGLILPRFLPYALAIAALLVVLLAAQLVLQRGFVRPALALVRQIQAEARGEPAAPPPVPPLWRPWVDAVREAFASRRASEARLAESEARFKAAAESMRDGLAIFDAEDRLVFYNSRYPTLLTESLRATLQIGRRWADWGREAAELGPIYHPEMGPDYLEQRIADRALPFCEREHRLVDGRWVRVRESRMPDGGRVLLTGDITARKESEARLKASEQRFLAAAESIPDGLLILDAEDRIAFYNSRYPEHLSPALREVLRPGTRFEDWMREGAARGSIYHPEMGPDFLERRLGLREGLHSEHEHRLADGRWMRLRENRMPDGGRVLLTTDVTASKEADEQLRRSEQRFLAAAESMPDGLVIIDAEDRIVFHNSRHPEHLPQALREGLRLGVRFEDWIREGLARGPVYHPDMGADYAERRLAGRSNERVEQEHKHADGRWVRVRESRMPDGGRVLLTTDVTEARLHREALADQTRKLEAVLANIAEGVSILDAEARVVLVNDGFLRLYDLPRELALPGTPFSAFVEHRLHKGSPPPDGVDLELLVRQRVQKLLAGDAAPFEETTRDGRTVLVRRERLPDGLLVSTYSDITLLKERERENALLATAVEQAGDSVEVTGPDYRLTYVNPAFCRLTGWTREEALGRTPAEILRSDRHDAAFFAEIDRTLRAGGTWQGLLISRHRDGHLLFQEAAISPLRDAQGKLTHYVAVKRDISERLRAEEALRESEARYRAVVETQTEFVMRMRQDGSLTFVNDAYCRQMGRSRAELLDPARNDLDAIAPEDRARYEAHVASLGPACPTRSIEIRSYRREGLRWEHWTDTGIFDSEGRLIEIQSVGHDITERKEAELRLIESEARYRAVVETQAEFVVRYSPQGWLTFANDAFCRYLGVNREQLFDPAFEGPILATPEGQKHHLDYLARVSPDHPTETVELRRVLPDGSERYELWTDTGVFDAQGRLVEVQAVGRDVTLAKQAESALRESEARYRAVIEGQTEFILRLRPDGTLTFVNDAYCRYRGLPREVLLAGFDDIAHYPAEQQALIRAAWASVSRERPTVTYELEEPGEDGGLRYEEWTDTGIFDSEGRLIEIQAVGRDVSERRRAEVALEESRELLRAIVDDQTELVARFDADQRLVFCNAAHARLLHGKTPEEVIGTDLFEPVPEWFRSSLQAGLQGLTPEQPVFRSAHETVLPSGELRWFEWVDRALFDPQGACIGYQAVGRDITEQRRAEAALKQSEEFLRAIVDDQTELVARFDADFRLVFCNAAHARTFHDAGPEEALGRELFSTVPEEYREKLRSELLALTPERPVYRGANETMRPDGEMRWFEWVDRALFDAEGRRIGMQSVGRDVTEQRRAEAALKESEARLAAFMDHAPVGMYLKGLDGRYLMLNPEMAKVFGRPVAEMLGRDPAEVLTPEEARTVEAYDRAILKTGAPARHEEFLSSHDAYRWTMVIRFPVRDATGRIVQIGGFDVDISQQKRALAELEASEQRFRAIADIHPAPMIITRLHDHRVVFANRAYFSAFGLTAEALESFDQGRLHAGCEECEAIYATVAATGALENYEIEMRTAGGARFPALLTARTIEYEGQPCCVMAFLDLSALKAAEAMIARQREALYQSEKLTALGSLLAGVAHELNNPLSVVTGYAEMLRDTAPDAATRGRAERVHAAAERCARIVKTFLAMARSKPPQRGPVALPKMIEGALELAGYGLRTAGVEVALEFAPDLPEVWGDADQLHQVLVNLVVNAQHALTAVAPPRRLTIRTLAQAGEVVVEVEDNGPGMPPEVRKRIFEPFFTTKPQGVGTGVGLSVCHGIVTAHGGRIEVETAPERGTLFRFGLPPALASGTQAHEAAEAIPAGRGRVLVVDDEREIAELVAETLVRDGFEVETVTSGRTALARLAKGGIDLVLSDLRMPDTDGATLIEAVREASPELVSRMILITGDALGAGTNEVVREAGVPVLEKPLDLKALRQEVRRRLEA